ncbi:MAG TPA: ABC transporter ATP-binding protein [Bryobacteraceae bacterium]|nr:ABC transporter ATP-binding protein [Bryobacteraceae bacterium]
MMLLAAQGLSKRYGRNQVLRQAAFRVRENEVLGLIGPNGAGKTTLFECLAGLVAADSGEVQFRGHPLDAVHRKQALFYLPDGIRPWESQPVRWALRFFESLYGRPAGEGLAFAGSLQLEHLLGARIGSLSKGEAKRALLALALLTPHPLLLLDEPFDGLDFRQTRDVMALVRTLPARGRTLFLSIHQLADAARVCDRLVLLSRGLVVGEGTLDELRAQAGKPEGGLEEVFLALTA